MLKKFGLLVFCLGLFACASTPGLLLPGNKVFNKKHPIVVPKYEPRTRAGNKSPYTVFGKTYEVLPTAAGYVKQGTASWYGKKFHGRDTSNGERFDMYAISAAHKTLPIPSYVKVTNLANNRSLVLRINDRGPFHGDRIIDLSYAAAVELGFDIQGTTEVVVEAIEIDQNGQRVSNTKNVVPKPVAVQPQVAKAPQPKQTAATPNVQPTPQANIIGGPSIGRYLQLGAYNDLAKANKLAETIRQNLAVNALLLSPQNGMHRVAVGPVDSDKELERIKAILLFEGYKETFIVYEFDKPAKSQ